MDFELSESQKEIRAAVTALCARFGNEYWHRCDSQNAYPEEFVKTLSEAGWLAALIPQEYGGAGLGMIEASLILEEINRSGGNAVACHAQMYTMASILKHGSAEQKRKYLPRIASGELRLQSFGITEPDAGSETPRIKTFARREGDHYVVNGQKIFTSRFQNSDMLLLLTRTTPFEDVRKKTDGMSLFLVDLKAAGSAIKAVPIATMVNHTTNQLFIDDLVLPREALVGEEGKGFSYLLSSLNAERILVGSQSVGDGRWFVEYATKYSKERRVFDRPIGMNQGVQFPIAKAHVAVEAASLMRFKAAALFDAGKPCGAEANMTKYLASEAAWEAGEAAMNALGGYGFAKEYHVERKWREARLYRTAPIANNLILSFVGEHLLGMPRSY
ncbi:MAG TPA: acyl-CoA dehydrogenase family protein [Candidatus Binataceae bacterium]|nr:acyl-CoA dehydrogenase family protein [Candidatus Binataceae bacterium]